MTEDLNFLNRVAQNGGVIPDDLRTGGDAANPADDEEKARKAAETEALKARLGRLGIKFSGQAGHTKLTELLNTALDDDSKGLSRREINADLTEMGVEFDPDGDYDALVAQRDEARAQREGGI